jgi:HEPN domain-containing protein
MPDDPQRSADTQSWLSRSREDLRAAEVDLLADPALVRDAAFHCQQAAEKSLKAFLTWHDVPFRRTHDLAEIGYQCVTLDSSLEDVCHDAASLSTFAWIFRYPGETEEPTPEEVQEFLSRANRVYDAIVAHLPHIR